MSNDRAYRSTLREERAEETRLRIRNAAHDLIAEVGFADATIARIAEEAGVAPQTVYAVFGSKGGIVASMLEVAEQSAAIDERIGAVLAEDNPHRQLRLFVTWIRTLFETGAPMFRAALQARYDPEVAVLAQRGDGRRKEGTRRLVDIWAGKRALRDGLDPADAAERLWLLTSVEQFFKAIDELGWDADRYEQWLGDLLERELLGD